LLNMTNNYLNRSTTAPGGGEIQKTAKAHQLAYA
jgi:hypothetical protein